ncbi:hypothetical protein [Nitrosomonas sp. Nm34]|uniref:hypothetical protein n=1 Tax=Nitrosomonas sp. Nm34 TaxID=1881055 RepID=UPI001113541C|nr:hypothetical protein [Nitrosomonas sp. Nm34]
MSESSLKRRYRRGELCLSEVMTIMVEFHLSGYRTFKHYHLNDVLRYQRGYFPGLLSYYRLVELLQDIPIAHEISALRCCQWFGNYQLIMCVILLRNDRLL